MAYKSKIDLGGLGEVPKTTENETFADFTDIYNAIHILTRWVNALVERAEAEGDNSSDKAPWESMTFERWIWLPARVQITKGEVISSVYVTDDGANFDGVYKGAHYIRFTPTGAGWGATKVTSLVGVALEDAAPGELVKFGVGPAIINIGGVKAGDKIYCRPAVEVHSTQSTVPVTPNDGQMYLNPPGLVGVWPSASYGSPEWPVDQTQYGTSKSGPIVPGKGKGNSLPYMYTPVAVGVGNDAAMFLGPQLMADYIV